MSLSETGSVPPTADSPGTKGARARTRTTTSARGGGPAAAKRAPRKAAKPSGAAAGSADGGETAVLDRAAEADEIAEITGSSPAHDQNAASSGAREADGLGPAGGGASGRAAGATATKPLHLPADRYLDREQSWVRFNERVLELAEDDSIPLLERVRFLAIFASNLDEFFMVRVAGLMRRMAAGFPVEGAGSQTASQVLRGTLAVAREVAGKHAATFREMVQPALAAVGIEILRWRDLTADEQDDLSDLFRRRIYPVLTPLVVDPSHPFPFISGLSLNLAVVLAAPPAAATVIGGSVGISGAAGGALNGGATPRTDDGPSGQPENRLFARVKVPPRLPRFLKASEDRYVPIEDVIAAHLSQLFGGLKIIEHHAFRVTRVRELEVDEEVTENLLQAMERELVRRRFDPAVRLEVEDGMSDSVLDRLAKELGVDENAVFKTPGPLDLTGLNAIADLPRGELRFPAFVPSTRALPRDASIFTTLAERDILVHHPYDSFAASVERLIEEAAADPRVLAIKQTLYRTGGESPIVDALIDAAEAGKEVVVVVEIKARFDERANIAWARKLEEAGCHVVYGFVGMKTHCKCVLIVREEQDGTLRRYCHIGTGNYHPKTARSYEDYGLLTADPHVGEDVTDLFNHLTGYSRKNSYRRLLVAPEALRAGMVGRIGRQAARARTGKPSRIAIKCNALVDEVVIDALYRASQAGVPIDIWVRGICALRPGIPGLSETVRVRSVLGRFLEHSRIYAFGTGDPDPDEPADARISANEVWLGSADMMHRNLDRRVEVLVRVGDPAHAGRLRGLIDRGMAQTTASWWLSSDGEWVRHARDDEGKPLFDVQESLISKRRVRGTVRGDDPAYPAGAGN
ncbi:MAG TPA: polyphosphate kinase 1 [Trebonia sp.]|nr:polyphosphate kinase 1 [Trebonia sp.]